MKSLEQLWVKRPWFELRHLLFPWLFKLIEFFALIAAIFFVIVWLSECDDRRKERHYRAWEVINGAAHLPGDGGRSDALENLAKDGRSLAGAFLECAHLPEINLRKADLSEARMKGARLYGADFEDAVLNGADLQGADLSSSLSCPGTNYRWSYLDYPAKDHCQPRAERRTNLKGARLMHADLQAHISTTLT